MIKKFSEEFDVVIVGSGPSGGECARELAKKGRKVLIIEKSTGIGRPNFSSGGTPLETFKEFNLPAHLGRGSWSKILIGAYGVAKTWDYRETRGYVFAFDELKQFLVGVAVYKARENGVSEVDHGTADMITLLKNFIQKFPELDKAEPMDLHGGNIYVTGGLKEHSRDGLLTIGDAAMQINPLAGEGIRHALHSGRMAAEVIDEKLARNNNISQKALSKYDKLWGAYTGEKWRLSYFIAEKLYGNLSESQWKYIMQILAGLSPEEAIKAGFDFEFLKVLKFKDVLKALKINNSPLVGMANKLEKEVS